MRELVFVFLLCLTAGISSFVTAIAINDSNVSYHSKVLETNLFEICELVEGSITVLSERGISKRIQCDSRKLNGSISIADGNYYIIKRNDINDR